MAALDSPCHLAQAYEIEHTKWASGWHTAAFTMDKITSDRVRELCSRIQAEHNLQRFLDLIQELNHILGEGGNGSEENPQRSPESL